MSSAEQIPIFGALAVMGLTGGLHCIGMCGPLILGLSNQSTKSHWLKDLSAHHLGRIWTYGLLGLFAGMLGQKLESVAQSQQWLGLVFGALICIQSIFLFMGKPTRMELWLTRIIRSIYNPVNAQTGHRSWLWRFLTGSLMGLMPCGLVWFALIPAASLKHPLLSMVGMLVFGLGTTPLLSSIVVADRFVGPRIRKLGKPIAAILLLSAGLWMLSRSVMLNYNPLEPAACHTSVVAVEP